LQASIAQLSDYDRFHFSGGLDGGVKVSGGDNFAAPDNEIRHLPGTACKIFAMPPVAIFNEFNVLCELTTVGGKLIICRLFFEQRQFFVNGNQDCNTAVCSMLKRTVCWKPRHRKNSFIFKVLHN